MGEKGSVSHGAREGRQAERDIIHVIMQQASTMAKARACSGRISSRSREMASKFKTIQARGLILAVRARDPMPAAAISRKKSLVARARMREKKSSDPKAGSWSSDASSPWPICEHMGSCQSSSSHIIPPGLLRGTCFIAGTCLVVRGFGLSAGWQGSLTQRFQIVMEFMPKVRIISSPQEEEVREHRDHVASSGFELFPSPVQVRNILERSRHHEHECTVQGHKGRGSP